MPHDKRPPSFQFYPGDWLSDPAVQGMTFEEQGRYHHLLCLTHQTDTPGIMSEDQARRFCCYTPEEWPEHRPAIAAAFSIRGSKWIQKRTVLDRNSQKLRRSLAQKGAALTNEARWGKVAQRRLSDRSATRSAVTPSSSSSSASASKAKNLQTDRPLSKDLTPAPGRPKNGPQPGPSPVGLSLRSVSEPDPHPSAEEQLAALAKLIAAENP